MHKIAFHSSSEYGEQKIGTLKTGHFKRGWPLNTGPLYTGSTVYLLNSTFPEELFVRHMHKNEHYDLSRTAPAERHNAFNEL